MLELFPGRVMVFGTNDVFHPGHAFFLNEAGKRGQELVVVIARDVTVKKIKPLLRNAEAARMKVVQEQFPEAHVVLGDELDHMKVIREYRPELVCLGYDQIGFSERLMEEFPEIRIERLESHMPEKYKSSKMA